MFVPKHTVKRIYIKYLREGNIEQQNNWRGRGILRSLSQPSCNNNSSSNSLKKKTTNNPIKESRFYKVSGNI